MNTVNAIARSLLLCVLLVWPVQADVQCDGVDDDASTGVSLVQFMSVGTGSMTLWYKPTGTPGSISSFACYDGERLFIDEDTSGGTVGFHRNAALGGNDRLCATNWTGSEAYVEVAYTVDVWTHLAWVHTGGSLLFYKDGLLVGSTPSGDSTPPGPGPVRLCGGAIPFTIPGQGVFAEAAIFDVALTPREIQILGQSRVRHLGFSAATGAWSLDDCAPGASADGVSLRDQTIQNRPMVGDNGANNTGLLCAASSLLTYPWGIE